MIFAKTRPDAAADVATSITVHGYSKSATNAIVLAGFPAFIDDNPRGTEIKTVVDAAATAGDPKHLILDFKGSDFTRDGFADHLSGLRNRAHSVTLVNLGESALTALQMTETMRLYRTADSIEAALRGLGLSMADENKTLARAASTEMREALVTLRKPPKGSSWAGPFETPALSLERMNLSAHSVRVALSSSSNEVPDSRPLQLEIEAKLLEAIKSVDTKHLVVDLSALQRFSLHGCMALVSVNTQLKARGGTLRVVAPAGASALNKITELGLHRVFNVHSSMPEAEGAIGSAFQ